VSVAKNSLLIFERKLSPLDNLGGQPQRVEVCKAYANLEPLSGRELQNANQTQAQTTHKISLFYSAATANITPACRD
jgi:head-tail adaptor